MKKINSNLSPLNANYQKISLRAQTPKRAKGCDIVNPHFGPKVERWSPLFSFT